MYAVIKTGGKQYRVQAGDVLEVERVQPDAQGLVAFDQVLAVGDGEQLTLGTPTVPGAVVAAELVEQFRGDKITVLKFKRRKGYKKKQGHRQDLSRVRITEIMS